MQFKVTHPFDVAMAARGRRRELKLRQSEVAAAAQVGREWLVDLEHGKPTCSLELVLKTLTALGIDVYVEMGGPAPPWSQPFTEAARLMAERRAAPRPRKRRRDIEPPADYPQVARWNAWKKE